MSEARPAGFWIRTVALAVDALLFLLVQRSLGLVARRVWGATAGDTSLLHGTITLFTLLFAGLYVVLLHAGTGQTIGKMLVRAHVVMLDGDRVPVGTAVLRAFGLAASGIPLGLGYAMAGLRRDKRALHDLLAGTRVERRLPARAPEPLDPLDPLGPPESAAPPVP